MTAEQTATLQNLAIVLVNALIDDTTQTVVFIEDHDDANSTLHIQVAPSETGKIVGKNGHMARMLRGYLYAAGKKYGITLSTNIVEQKH